MNKIASWLRLSTKIIAQGVNEKSFFAVTAKGSWRFKKLTIRSSDVFMGFILFMTWRHQNQFIPFSGFEVWNNILIVSCCFFYHLLLKNIMVTYIKTKCDLGWERHNVSTSQEEFLYKKLLQKRNRGIDIQKNRRCSFSGAILYEKG